MKNQKRVLILLAGLVCMFAVISAALAISLALPEGRSRNVITTGNVEISIREDSLTGDGMVTGVEKTDGTGIIFENIMPGMTASKIVNIKNEAEPCWLRVEVMILVTPEPGSEPSLVIKPNIDVTSADSKWKYEGGYYYYTDVLQHGDSTEQPLFTSVLFAPQMGNEYAGSEVQVVVRAEAIQYKHNEVSDVLQAWPDTEG